MRSQPIIAVIGLGNISKRHRKNIRALCPQAQVIAMSASGRGEEAVVPDADQVCSDIATVVAMRPDFAIVASPATLHAQHAVPLIESGVPVLVEKPVDGNVTAARELLAAQKRTGVPVAVGYCLRYLPSIGVVRNALAGGSIGRVETVIASVGQFLPSWRPGVDFRQSVSARKALGGGVLLELSHEIDYLRLLFGHLELEHAVLRNTMELSLEVEEIADVVLKNAAHAICSLHMDFTQRTPLRRCSILGSHGRIEWDAVANTVDLWAGTQSSRIYAGSAADKDGMYTAMIEDFVGLIEGKPSNCATLDEGVAVMELIDEIKRRAKQYGPL